MIIFSSWCVLKQSFVRLLCVNVLIVIVGCSQGFETTVPQTYDEVAGAHTMLPKTGTRAVLWAPDPTYGSMDAYGAAMPWLQRRDC